MGCKSALTGVACSIIEGRTQWFSQSTSRSSSQELTAAWNEWNATMLPEVEHSFTEGFSGSQIADHLGTPPVSQALDPTLPGSQPPSGQHPSVRADQAG
jgi:hypothetical protein